MPLTAAPIVISDSVRRILSSFAKSRTLPARQVQRAKIFLACSDGLSNLQISSQIELGQDSVSKWRTRFLKHIPRLLEIEEKSPDDLKAELTVLLMDIPRPGPPPSYIDAQACRNPSDYGYELSQWSLNQLVAAAIKEGIVDSISAKTIGRFLKYGENPPASRPLPAAFLRESGPPRILYREGQ